MKFKNNPCKYKLGFLYLVIFLLTQYPSLYATHEISLGVNSAISANQSLLTNPPLPMLYYKKGDYKFFYLFIHHK